MKGSKEKLQIIIAGLLIGVVAAVLVLLGNPANMGFCIACFIRDTAGALGLHRAAAVQYLRPEIIGIILGSFLLSLAKMEFTDDDPTGISSIDLDSLEPTEATAIYDLSGRQMPQGRKLPQGTYIMKTNGMTIKVQIRK